MRIGITGGIGAGKSFVANLLRTHFGIPVYDCDSEAKRLMTTSSEMRQKLTALVGPQAYDDQGGLNRQVMAQFLFASEDHAQRINAIVHPVVRRDFEAWAERQVQAGQRVMGVESAVLFEAGMEDAVDWVLYVDAPMELRVQRAMLRDGATRDQVLSRVARQRTSADALRGEDAIVVNDGRNLLPQLQQLLSSKNI